MTNKVVYLFRHGEVEQRYEGCYRGTIDCELSPEGVEMSLRTARFLLQKRIERVITTGMKRTDIVARKLAPHGIPHTLITNLREMHLGEWEGIKKTEVRQRWPELHARLLASDIDVELPGTTDTPRKLRERVAAAWRQIVALSEERVGVVAHAGANAILLSQLKGLPPEFVLRVGAMSEILVEEGVVRVIRENVDISGELE